jgi:uncharacterized protein (TIGR02246 family)
MSKDEQAVAAMMMTYQNALNASDTDAVMTLYASDGVFMPQNSPSSVGVSAIREAYEAVFSAITLTVAFTIAEIRQVAADWVFVRTNSAGSVKVKANGESGPEANQELFLFQKVDDAWKIARYCFCTTNPPRS